MDKNIDVRALFNADWIVQDIKCIAISMRSEIDRETCTRSKWDELIEELEKRTKQLKEELNRTKEDLDEEDEYFRAMEEDDEE